MKKTLYVTHHVCSLHMMQKWHPESPKRLEAINDRLLATGLYFFLESQDAPCATVDDLLRCHSLEHIEFIRDNIPEEGYFNVEADETVLNPYTWKAALRAAGAGILAVDKIMTKDVENAFCAVRPPGHHAERSKATGFCFFNNIAIAAAYALEKYNLSNIAIIDFDVHHGNGTADIFKDHPQVEMYSFFQSPLFPFSGTEDRSVNMHNTPVPAYTDASKIHEIIETQWLPGLKKQQPEMIFISAGFDAHREDEMAQMNLVEQDYVLMTEKIMAIADEFCDGRVISLLEGGYSLSSLGRSATEHIRTLSRL